MPQMSPLNRLTLFFLFITVFLIFNLIFAKIIEI